MITIKFKCPHCGRIGISQILNKRTNLLKKRVRCVKCNKSFYITKAYFNIEK